MSNVYCMSDMRRKAKRPKTGRNGSPRWTVRKKTVSVTMSLEWAKSLDDMIARWRSFGSWTTKADCKNWKRSSIARENRRESITFSNCASELSATLGRAGLAKVKKASGPAAVGK